MHYHWLIVVERQTGRQKLNYKLSKFHVLRSLTYECLILDNELSTCHACFCSDSHMHV